MVDYSVVISDRMVMKSEILEKNDVLDINLSFKFYSVQKNM